MPPHSHLYSRPPRWRQSSGASNHHTPPRISSWLFEQGSLTRRLQCLCGPNFNLKLIGQTWTRPFNEERLRLGLKQGQRALIREVALCFGNKPLVLARSVIPASTLKGVDRRLGKLGTRPLGQILFSHPNLRRLTLECASIILDSTVIPNAQASRRIQQVWGRRSLYSLGSQHTLLVAEFFLPDLFELPPTETGK